MSKEIVLLWGLAVENISSIIKTEWERGDEVSENAVEAGDFPIPALRYSDLLLQPI